MSRCSNQNMYINRYKIKDENRITNKYNQVYNVYNQQNNYRIHFVAFYIIPLISDEIPHFIPNKHGKVFSMFNCPSKFFLNQISPLALPQGHYTGNEPYSNMIQVSSSRLQVRTAVQGTVISHNALQSWDGNRGSLGGYLR